MCAFRQMYSRIDNDPQASATSSLEMVIVMNGQRIGRCQGFRISGQAAPRPVTEIGSDRRVEFVPGIKAFSATIQSITIKYGDLITRLASMSGTPIDPDSISATLSNFPDFDIEMYDRGNPDLSSPQLYAAPSPSQNLAGAGKLVKTAVGCVIESFDQNINANESLIMESVSIQFVEMVIGNGKRPKTIATNVF